MPHKHVVLQVHPPLPTVSEYPQVQQEYIASRRSGSSHKLAEMLVTQTPPGLQTDTRFMTGTYANTRYSHQLARFPGDPQAYIGSRRDAERVAAANGMTIEGSANYRPLYDDAPDPERYEVAEDIVQDELSKMQAKHGEQVVRDDPGLEQRIRDACSGRVDLSGESTEV